MTTIQIKIELQKIVDEESEAKTTSFKTEQGVERGISSTIIALSVIDRIKKLISEIESTYQEPKNTIFEKPTAVVDTILNA